MRECECTTQQSTTEKSASPVVSVCVYIKEYPKMRTQTHRQPKKRRENAFDPNELPANGTIQLLSVDCIRRYPIFIFAFRQLLLRFSISRCSRKCMCVRVFYLSPRVKCLFNGVRFSRIIESVWGSFRHVSLSLSSLLSRHLCVRLCVCSAHIFSAVL